MDMMDLITAMKSACPCKTAEVAITESHGFFRLRWLYYVDDLLATYASSISEEAFYDEPFLRVVLAEAKDVMMKFVNDHTFGGDDDESVYHSI